MEERPIDHMIGFPTTKTVDHLQEQLAKCMAGLRNEEATNWAKCKYGCLALALEDANFKLVTKGVLISNARLTVPKQVHAVVKDNTGQKELLRLGKLQDNTISAYIIQEAATKIGVSTMVASIAG